MENPKGKVESLFERFEDYGKTSFELFKLKFIEQATDVLSTVAVRVTVLFVLLVFILIASVGGAIWLGDLLGKIYYGFFIIAGVYLLLAIILRYLLHESTRRVVANFIIKQVLK